MHIKIAQKLRPFTHTPGTYCLLPGTCLRFKIYPTLLCIDELSTSKPKRLAEIQLTLSGPVAKFTVMQDLEKGVIRVWGDTSNGFFRYEIAALKASSTSWLFTLEKSPVSGLVIKVDGEYKLLSENCECSHKAIQAKDCFIFALKDELPSSFEKYTPPVTDRLSLGVHKSQDWNQVTCRKNMDEIFPFWLRLGQLLPKKVLHENKEGTITLLEQCRHLLAIRDRTQIKEAFLHLFSAGFEGILSPSLEDQQHQGFDFPLITSTNQTSPLVLLTVGAELIRQIFIFQKQEGIDLLSVLPPTFHSGRFLHVQCQEGLIDLEWSNKALRRLIYYTDSSHDLHLNFPASVKSFRLRTSENDKGQIKMSDSTLAVEKGNIYYLDKFKK